MKNEKKYLGTRQTLIWYLPKLLWLFAFLTIGLCLLILGKKLFSNQFGQFLLGAFIVAILLWSKGAFKRYKLWKNRMYENNKPIRWHSWFKF